LLSALLSLRFPAYNLSDAVAEREAEGNLLIRDMHDPFGFLERIRYVTISIREHESNRLVVSYKTEIGEDIKIKVPSGLSFYIEIGRTIRNRFYGYTLTNRSRFYILKSGSDLTLDLASEILKEQIYRDVYLKLLTFQEAVDVLKESGYDIPTLLMPLSKLQLYVSSAFELAEKGEISQSLSLYQESKSICNEFERNLYMIQIGVRVSLIVLLSIIVSASLILGRLAEIKGFKYPVDAGIYSILIFFFLLQQPDFKIFGMSSYGLFSWWMSSSAYASQRIVWAFIFLLILFFIIKWALHELSLKFPEASKSIEIGLRWIRGWRLAILISTVIVITACLIALTTTSIFHGGWVTKTRNIDNNFDAIIIQPSPYKNSIDFWISSLPSIQMASPLVYNPASVVLSGGSVFRPFRLSKASSSQTSLSVEGIIGLDPASSNFIYNLSEGVKKGSWLKSSDAFEVLISEEMARELKVNIGSKVNLTSDSKTLVQYTIVGLYDPDRILEIRQLNGYSLLGELPGIGRNFLITTVSGALASSGPSKARLVSLTLILKPGFSVENLSSSLLFHGYYVWTISNGTAKLSISMAQVSIRGLQFHVPLILIGSLIIFDVMWASVYERRRDIFTLTCIGLTPSNIRNIFFFKCLMITSIGSILGLILGTFILPYLNIILPSLEEGNFVKAGPVYPLLTIIISIFMAFLGGYIPAKKAMRITTPSLQLRWKFKGKRINGNFEVEIPSFLKEEEILDFHRYITILKKFWGENAVAELKGFNITDTPYTYAFDAYILGVTGVWSRVLLKCSRRNKAWYLSIFIQPYGTFTSRHLRYTIDVFRKLILDYSTRKYELHRNINC